MAAAVILKLKEWRILAEDVSTIRVEKMNPKEWIDLFLVTVFLKSGLTIDETHVQRAEAVEFGEQWIARQEELAESEMYEP